MGFNFVPALLTEVNTDQIVNEAVTYEKLGTDFKKLKLLETLNPSSVNTITSGSLEVFDYYYIELKIQGSSTSDNLKIRINGLSTNIYTFTYINNGTSGRSANQNALIIGYTEDDLILNGNLLINGKGGSGNGYTGVSINTSGVDVQTYLSGVMNLGANTQVDNITLLSGQNFTGVIKIYGGNV